MKKVFRMSSFLLLLFFRLTLVQAETYHKYDYCTGSQSMGGFSDREQLYTVRAYADGNVSDDSFNSAIVIHIDGSPTEFIFDSLFTGDQQQRLYVGKERYQEDHFAKLMIKCTSASDRYCPAELITNLFGSKKTYHLGCFIGRIDYPSPGQDECRRNRCR